MPTLTRHIAKLAPLALASSLALPCSLALGAVVAPLPRSEYTTRTVCASAAVGRAGCLALQLVPRTAQAAARSHPLGVSLVAPLPARSPAAGDFGLRPKDLHSGYALPVAAPSPQTVAIVDAYNDPTIEADLAAYDAEFSLPPCTAANGCLTQVSESGKSAPLPFPTSTLALENARKGSPQERKLAAAATGWDLEISLDIEAVHATCQSCKILLVEAESPQFSDLESAERSAEALGASEISNSWGGPEQGLTPALESASPFDHPGTVITASAGDNGYLGSAAAAPAERGYAEFPASSPHVVAVGGTRLALAAGGAWSAETVWNDSGESGGVREGFGAGGGGCSTIFAAPAWQLAVPGWGAVGCENNRVAADVAAVADPYSGLAVYDSSPECEYSFEGHVSHWCTIAGTSLASPVIAAVFALAGGSGGAQYPAATLYAKAALAGGSLHDIAAGSNGACAKPFQTVSGVSSCTAAEEAASNCESHTKCLATAGFDGPTGVGTPRGIAAFTASAPSGEAEPAPPGAGKQPTPLPEEPARVTTGTNPPAQIPPIAPVVPQPGGSPNPGTPTPGAGPATPLAAPRITSLALTRGAVLALNTSAPRVVRVGFSFTLSVATHVRVTLLRRVRLHGRLRWLSSATPLTIAAGRGRNGAHLRGGGRLAAGLYRLTVALPAGSSRTVSFHLG